MDVSTALNMDAGIVDDYVAGQPDKQGPVN